MAKRRVKVTECIAGEILADVFDAMTSNRVYKKGVSPIIKIEDNFIDFSTEDISRIVGLKY